eukprot:5115989-Amphidinium_carterae.1
MGNVRFEINFFTLGALEVLFFFFPRCGACWKVRTSCWVTIRTARYCQMARQWNRRCPSGPCSTT